MADSSVSPSRRRFFRLVGGLLLALASVYLLLGVILRPIVPPPVHAVLDGVYDALLCGPDETYQQDPFLRGALRRNTVSTGDAWCLSTGGVKRDISYSEFNVAIALFLVPLLLGFSLLMVGIAGSSFGTPRQRTQTGRSDLSTRLTELKAAFDQGLITRDEYEVTRQNILKQMEK